MLAPLFLITAKLRTILRRNFVRITIFLLGIVVYGTISEYYLERGASGTGVKSIFDSLWFVMQTITTVGYGDTPVVTFWGRMNAIFLMIFGIGVLAFFSASFASLLIEYSTRRRLGEQRIKLKNHIVVCNWNSVADQLILEMVKEKPLSVLLLAPLEMSPSEKVVFVRGTCLHFSDLERANVSKAESVTILAETITDGELASAIDAKTILGIMNVRKQAENVHIVAELLKRDSIENARMAGANEVVVRGEVSAKLLSRGTLYPGTIDVLETILTAKSGEEIFEDKIPGWASGKKWIELTKFFIERNATPIALRNKSGLTINPPPDSAVDQAGSIVYISSSKIKQ
ncbi:MAG: potassium channel protein [Nitrososphaerota archaeon]|nr:potassium channel protein [Nitrososphaerota archaeon]